VSGDLTAGGQAGPDLSSGPALQFVLAIACLLLASCGGASKSSPTAGRTTIAPAPATTVPPKIAAGAPKSAPTARLSQLTERYAACLGEHGANVRAPGAAAYSPLALLKGLDLKAPSVHAALLACRPMLRSGLHVNRSPTALSPTGSQPARAGGAGAPTATTPKRSPVKVPAKVTRIMTSFTACMRAHGIASFPEPTRAGFNMSGLHLNLQSAQFKAAENACNSILEALDPPTPAG
jgi:hypothetical protein